MRTPMMYAQKPGLAGALSRRPIIAAVAIALGDALIRIPLQFGLQRLLAEPWAEFATLTILAVLTIGLLIVLDWWEAAGFNRPSAWRSLGLLWLPAALIFVLPFVLGFRGDELGMFGLLAVAYVIVGLREEALFRGIILYLLGSLGPMRAALLCSALFGLSHLSNLFFRPNPAIVLAQVVGAATSGFGYAALRLRTNTIWPLIVLHAVGDLTLHYSVLPVIPIEVIRGVVMVCYGVYLLWGWQAPPLGEA